MAPNTSASARRSRHADATSPRSSSPQRRRRTSRRSPTTSPAAGRSTTRTLSAISGAPALSDALRERTNRQLGRCRAWKVPSKVKQNAKALVLADCSGRCVFCATAMTEAEMTLDHVEPRALGGSNDLGNLVAACRSCNEFKDSLGRDRFFDENLWAARNFVRYASTAAAEHLASAHEALRGPYADSDNY